MTKYYYTYLALLYEKAEGEGFLNLQDPGIPVEKNYKKVADVVLHGTSNTECYKLIGKLVEQYGLNKEFCDRIKHSPSLRYMLCENLHDARIDEFITDGADLEFLINCGDCMGKPIVDGFMQTQISVKFFGVKNFVFLEEGPHIKDFDYVTHEISYDENGGFIIAKIRLLKQRGNDLAYRDIVIHCDDIVVVGLSHEF